MQVYSDNQAKLAELQAQDKTLSQYQLEEVSKKCVFEWIRDFKDYEIRQGLQNDVNSLRSKL
jgi:hypothetical protein